MPKVLIVDDEEPVRDLFKDLLEREGYAVKSAGSGEEALELINQDNFEVVLLDIKLPGISGLETLKRIKGINENLIVIMITGFGYDEELISQSKEYGCSGYIGKNISPSEIISNFKLFVKINRVEKSEK